MDKIICNKIARRGVEFRNLPSSVIATIRDHNLEKISILKDKEKGVIVVTLADVNLAEYYEIGVDKLIENVSQNNARFIDSFDDFMSYIKGIGKRKARTREEAIIGLFGELLALETYLLESEYNMQTCVKAFRRPSGAAKDFFFEDPSNGNRHLEVKCVTRSKSSFIVNGEHQLDTSGNDELDLCIHIYQKHKDKTPSLMNLYYRIINLLDNEDENGILTREFKNKCFVDSQRDSAPIHIEEIPEKDRDFRIEVFDTSVYEVIDGFPRITPSDLMTGVEDVSYKISLAAIQDFKIS